MSWVVGRYEGEKAKSVMAHAASGIGYFILESGGNRFDQYCIAVFRYSGPYPLPPHLEEVSDPLKIMRYEEMKAAREGRTEKRR